MTEDIQRLVERIEAASESSRELDALICEAIALPLCVPPDCLPDVLRKNIAQTLDGSWPHDTESVPAYTASIDAAMTLIAPGKDACGVLWNVEAWDGPGVHAPHVSATAWVCGAPRVYAATPALALCAASLRARQSGKSGE